MHTTIRTSQVRSRRSLYVAALAASALTFGFATLSQAQTNDDTKDPTTGADPVAGTTTVTGETPKSPPAKNADAAKATDFVDLGGAIAAPALKLPAGAQSVRRVSAPLAGGKDSVMLNFYKLSGGLYMDVLTSHDNQAWTKQNHVVFKGTIPIRPEKMNVTLRYLKPAARKGFVVVASDESADMALVFPLGFGGKVSQNMFLVQSASGTRHSYAFGDVDSNGFVIVRETVNSTGQVKPSEDTQYFVWDGRTYIHRKAN